LHEKGIGMDVSIVIPLKDEKDNLARLHARITECMTWAPSYEILLVDDGSQDGSHLDMAALAARDARVKVVRLRRNFGQAAALQAGIDHATGDIIVTMDGDLQNDPADIGILVDKLKLGDYDAVFGQRANRQDSFLSRTLPSNIANWLIRKITGIEVRDMGCTLRALRADLAKSLSLYGEMHRFIPVLVDHAGAVFTQVPVQHHPRTAGRTKYNISRTVRVILDLITVKFMQGYLTRPMHILGLAGLFAMLLGLVSVAATVFIKLTDGTSMIRSPLLHLGVMLELIGVQLISTGLLGEVLARTYFESQGKRAYTVRATLNFEPSRNAVPADALQRAA
jgi:glycosyltransferase involved in cell wall biosynthesis